MKSFRETLKIDDTEPMAIGGEKRVYNHPDHPDRIITETRYTSVDAREVARRGFYLRKVMHFLFPESIPDIHMAGADLSVLEKRQKDSEHMVLQGEWNRYWSGKNESVGSGSKIKGIQKQREKDPNVVKFIAGLEKFGVSVDAGAVNFSYSPEGFVQYLDSIYDDGQIDLAAIEKEIYSRPESEGRTQAVSWLERYKKIRLEQSG